MRELNDIMDFDHVIEVHADGTITEPKGIYAPTLYEGELDNSEWRMLDGYSGQDRYSGPLMHNSEFIGGLMERDVRETPGVYVAIVSNYDPTCDICEQPIIDDPLGSPGVICHASDIFPTGVDHDADANHTPVGSTDLYAEGWAVAVKR